MRTPTLLIAGLLAGSLALSGCTPTSEEEATSATVASVASETEDAQTVSASTDLLTEISYDDLDVSTVDLDVDPSAAVAVTLSDAGSTGGDGVEIDGSTVTITAGGVYRLTGTLTAGRVVVDAGDEDVTLILDGVSITSDGIPAIDIEGADEALVWLTAGSTNTLASASRAGATADDATDVPNATLYSTADLWIAGTGSLTVDATAEDGITSKDGLVIADGTIAVNAADDGIRGKDHLVVAGGSVTVDAGGDGLRSDDEDVTDDDGAAVGVVWLSGGTVDVAAGADAVDAYRQATIAGGTVILDAGDDGVTAEGVVTVAGGALDITGSYEGLEGGVVRLTGGDGSIVASDDGINVSGGTSAGGGPAGPGGRPDGAGPRGDDSAETSAATAAVAATYAIDVATGATATAMGGMEQAVEGRYLEITGGTWYIDADGDGLDSNGAATMTGGTVVVDGPSGNGNGALDVAGTFEVSGGTLVAAGSSGMLESPEATGDQGVVVVVFSSAVAAGTTITLADADGSHVASFTTAKISQALVVSSGTIVAGEEYTVTAGGSVSGNGVGGLVTDGSATGGDTLGTVTAR